MDYIRQVFSALGMLGNISILIILFSTYTSAQDVYLISQAEVDAFDPSITNIDGSLHIGGYTGSPQDIVDLSNLSNIQSIQGILTIYNNDNLTTLNGLQSINYVKQNVRIYRNKALVDLKSFTSLKKVNAQIRIADNDVLLNLDGLESLDTIDGSLTIESNPELRNIDALQAIRYVARDLRILGNSKLTNVDGLSSVQSVGLDLEILINESLENVDGLINIQDVGGSIDLSSNKAMTSLNGLSSISKVNGSFDLLSSNVSNLDGLNAIDSIGGHIRINNNDALENIDALYNLKFVGDYLQLAGNDILTNLNGLSSLNYVVGQLRVSNNPLLSNCCGIQHLIENPELLEGGFNNSNNAMECDAVFDYPGYNCLKSYAGGIVFYDINENGMQDLNELGIPGINVKFNDDGFKRFTNSNGRYQSLLIAGEQYTLQVDIDENWQLTTDSMEYTFVFEEDDLADTNKKKDFGLVHNQPFTSAKVNLTSEATRCNSDVVFHIRALNNGLTAETGQIRLHLDPNVNYLSSSPEMTLDGQTLVFDFDTLFPYQIFDFDLILEMPSEQFTGEMLDLSIEMYLENQDGQLDIFDSSEYQSIVLCSYDPNDKQVSPPGVKSENYTLIDDLLSYTIRFQNTGNAPAIDIRILDTLDEGLDIETFRVVNTSFPVQTTIRDRAVEFEFNNIFLIDSLTNEEESHGFINYTIKARSDIEELDILQNTAHIIFDSNPAIITNTTLNTMVETICPDAFTSLDISICEGEEYLGYTESGNYELEYEIGITCDSFVNVLLTVLDTSLITIDTTICPGLDFLGFTEAGIYTIDTINEITGCKEELILDLSFYIASEPPCVVGTASEFEEKVLIYPNPTTGELNIVGISIESLKILSSDGTLIGTSYGPSININHLENGVYFLEIWNGVSSRMFRVVKIQ